MSEDRIQYLASGSGEPPVNAERLDLIRDLLRAEETWSEPPTTVAEQVLGWIATQGRDRLPEPDANGEGHRRAMLPWVAAAALLAVVVAVVSILGGTEDQTVVAMEGTALEAGAVGEAQVRPTDSGWWIGLDVEGLPAAPEGSYYEGWVWSDDGDGVSIGTFHLREGSEQVTLWSGVDPANYPSIWVTFEDEDGDPAASDRIVMIGRIDRG